MREVEALRRELAPHLKFLSGQVKKIEDTQKLREEIAEKYADYLGREHLYLRSARAELAIAQDPVEEHKELDAKIQHLRTTLEKKNDAGTDELIALEARGRDARNLREKLVREAGSIEGELRALARIGSDEGTLPLGDARSFGEEVLRLAEDSKWQDVLVLCRAFLQKIAVNSPDTNKAELEARRAAIQEEAKAAEIQETAVVNQMTLLRKKIENEKDANRDAERELFQAMARRAELEAALAALRLREESIAREEERFKDELREASVLLGRVLEYESALFEDEPRAAQEDRRRKLERLKIRLEESGAGNAVEILKEHKETTDRDQFLMCELQDLADSTQKLNLLIDELTKTLRTRFDDGVSKINKEFDNFFKLMFGGGTAALQVVKEKKLRRETKSLTFGDEGELEVGELEDDIEIEEGVDISVALPHKRIKGLHMLSGGERALTSIALIFAMSQVNPPPFLILDETDAALDEANSRRYGDMIETLAKHSQLIVITHNRETMSRAGVLYGVTMGQDAVSKLLSVKFEDALAVAK